MNARFAAAAAEAAAQRVVLRLYVSGPTPRSAQAIVNVRRLCEANLHGRYDLTDTRAVNAEGHFALDADDPGTPRFAGRFATAVTRLNALVSKYVPASPTLPKMSTVSLT